MTPPPERLAAALSGRYAIERELLPLFDSGEADGFLFFVTPYIEGETVRDRLERDTQLAVEEAVAIAADVADALDPAHGQGVIHRDLKPANILLRDGPPCNALPEPNRMVLITNWFGELRRRMGEAR